MELSDRVGQYTHGSKTYNHVLNEEIVDKSHGFTPTVTARVFDSSQDEPLTAEILVVVVQGRHAVSDLENICQFSICQELQNIGKLVIYISAEALGSWSLRLMEEATEEAGETPCPWR